MKRKTAGTLLRLPILAMLLIGASPALSAMEPYVHPQQLVRVGSIRLNLYCTGTGSPAVILEAGMGGTTEDWRRVQGTIAHGTRVCSYDRAGMGFSDGDASRRDAATIVSQLHALLHNARISPPYVLVAHSVAGLYAPLFADRYPTEVAGMVLIDPSTAYQERRMVAVAPADRDETRFKALLDDCYSAALHHDQKRLYADCLPTPAQIAEQCRLDGPALCRYDRLVTAQRSRVAFWYDIRSEAESFDVVDSAEVAKAQRRYGTMPLIVLTASEQFADPSVPRDQQLAEAKLWKQMHDELAAYSTVGVDFVVEGSGHYIQRDRPAAVVSAVDEVIDQVRASPGR